MTAIRGSEFKKSNGDLKIRTSRPENGVSGLHLGALVAFGLSIGFAAAPSAQAARGWFEIGYGTGALLDATDVTTTTETLGLARVPEASVGFLFNSEKHSVRPTFAIQYRVFSPATSTGTSFPLQTVTPMIGVAIKKTWIQIGLTPLLWTQSTAQPLAFFTGYTQRSDFLSGRVEVGYHYAITPEISIAGALGSQLFIRASDQTLNGQAVDGTLGFRFWFGGASNSAAKNRGFFGEGDDDYKGWRYPFGQGM